MKILLTGSAGFLGEAVTKRLQAANYEVSEFDHANGDDIRIYDMVDQAVSEADAVIHLAGILGTSELFDRVQEAIDINITGTANVLRACETYSVPYVGITMPESDWHNIYQATKHAATDMAIAYRDKGLPVSIVTAYNVYGPKQKYGPGHPRKLIPTFATKGWNKEPLPIYGSGEQTVDLIHVDDVAKVFQRALDALMQSGNSGYDHLRRWDSSFWDAGTGQSLTVMEIAQCVMSATDSHLIEFLPMRLGEKEDTEIRAKNPQPGITFSWDSLIDTINSHKP